MAILKSIGSNWGLLAQYETPRDIYLACEKIRTNITALFVISIFVNIGMWFERYVIIVVSLAGEPYEPWANAVYNPTWADWGIMAGSFGWFFMWFLLFVKNFPAVSISEVKEVLAPPKRQATRPGVQRT